MTVFSSLLDEALIDAIKNGAVAVVPTDTVYGLVCRAADEDAVKRLYALKHRDHKPGTVVAANVDQLAELGIKRRYLTAVEQFWPGAVSVEIAHGLEYLNGGTGRQAFRIPDEKNLRKLLEQTGPLLTTSANLPGEPTSTTVKEAQAYFGDKINYYADGGDLSGRPPSTIIRIIDDAIDVIRQGAVKIDQ
jgi:tRNA threonylcarbamoyl adenosine modification protein (Sua5/YciO/YrdC/YwlC family)